MTPNAQEVPIGATDDLSLRVSVATLVRVLFKSPDSDELMLALERRAILRRPASERAVRVKSQPFGGAIRIFDLGAMYDVLGDFHFDSERSRAEQDFRIFIRPSAWSALQEFCLEHIGRENDPILETSPTPGAGRGVCGDIGHRFEFGAVCVPARDNRGRKSGDIDGEYTCGAEHQRFGSTAFTKRPSQMCP